MLDSCSSLSITCGDIVILLDETGDVEEGLANNSHPSPMHAKHADKANDSDHDKEAKPELDVGHGGKERSVLQAKLTKLAIQIGYAGISLLQNSLQKT